MELENVKLWIPVAIGIGCLSYFSQLSEPSLFYGYLLFLNGLFAAITIRLFFPVYWKSYYLCTAIYLVAGGFCLAGWKTHAQKPFYRLPTHAVTFQGEITQLEILSSGKKRIGIRHVRFFSFPESEQKEWDRDIDLTLKAADRGVLEIGDWIEVKGMLSHPFPPALIAGYDMQFRAWFKGIGAYGYALSSIKVMRKGQRHSLRQLRETIAIRIGEVLSGDRGAIAQILLTGIEARLSPETRHDFAVSGLSHLLAIAGLHLGTVMLLVGGGIRWLGLRSEYIALYWPLKTIALIAGWIAGFIYLCLTGFHMPALRSLIMATLVILALFCNRQAISIHNLMIAALFILLCYPEAVLDVSFQMSMAAVMALITGYRIGYDRFFKREKTYSFFRKTLLHIGEIGWISILAGLAVCPIIMAHFHEFNPYFIFANLIAVPLTMIWILPCGILTLLALPFGLEGIFLHLMGWGIQLILILSHFIAHLPYANLEIADFPQWGLGLYFLGLCLLCLCKTPLRWLGSIFIGLGVISSLFFTVPDIVTSANGRMIGIRQEQTLWLACQSGCNKLMVDTWRKSLKTSRVARLHPLLSAEGIECNEYACKFLNKQVLLILKPFPKMESHGFLCRDIRLELSLLWDMPYCRDVKHFIGKDANWSEGAHSLWLTPFRMETDLAYRGMRPWVMEPIQQGIPNLPMAAKE